MFNFLPIEIEALITFDFSTVDWLMISLTQKGWTSFCPNRVTMRDKCQSFLFANYPSCDAEVNCYSIVSCDEISVLSKYGYDKAIHPSKTSLALYCKSTRRSFENTVRTSQFLTMRSLEDILCVLNYLGLDDYSNDNMDFLLSSDPNVVNYFCEKRCLTLNYLCCLSDPEPVELFINKNKSSISEREIIVFSLSNCLPNNYNEKLLKDFEINVEAIDLSIILEQMYDDSAYILAPKIKWIIALGCSRPHLLLPKTLKHRRNLIGDSTFQQKYKELNRSNPDIFFVTWI